MAPDNANPNPTHRSALMAYFLRRLKNPAEAEDLTQEVLIRISRVDPADMRSPSAYMFGVAANLLRDRARREQVRGEYQGELALEGDLGIDLLDPSRIMSAQQSLETLQTALGELPKLARTIFILHRIENVPRREIARTYRISEAAVDRQLAKALSYLITRVQGDAE